ncbi:MAG: AAA family ATPase [Flavobacterium sp.]
MRIAKIKVEAEKTKVVNLQEINLTKRSLGSVVALVGENGAGKSRILNFVKDYTNTISAQSFFDDYIINILKSITHGIEDQITNGKAIHSRSKNSNSQAHIAQVNQYYSSVKIRLKQISNAYIKIIDNDELQNIKDNINGSLSFENILNNEHFNLLDSNPNYINQINNQPKLLQNLLLNEINQFNNNSTIQYLVDITTDLIRERVNLFLKNETLEKIEEEIKKKKPYKLFNKFQEYIKIFLGKEFIYQQIAEGNSFKSVLYFNNQPFEIKLLSPGQKTLFAYAILFFYLETNSKANIKESIIIIDEPEKHLHPEAQIKLIDAIKSIVKDKGQLWIATHSIHILSHLEFDEILMVKDDEIIPPSRTTPGKSFNDLMGLEGHVDELSTFINSISEWAYANFMTQCFIEPDVVFGNNIDDPQFKLFKEFLIKKNNINLLDYGAGKGRIGHTIWEDEETSKKVIYSAFEPNKDNLEFLTAVKNISNVYTESNEIPEKKYDCVLLCNVLHEIMPEKWVEVFENIKRVLKSDGYLLIIEDKFLPKGENANDYGYLILGTEETKKLLNAEEIVDLKLKEKELSERILFNAFTHEQINPSIISVIDSLESLNKNSFKRIKALRKDMIKTSDVSVGRKYANETQLYINSTLALENFKIIKPKSATIEKV